MDILDYSDNGIEKKYITLLYEDKETRVTWYADTPLNDTKEAILSACESLCDSEFDIIDFQAKPIDINLFKDFKEGSIFFVRKINNNNSNSISSNNSYKTNNSISNKRKVLVQIPALKHIESQVAIKYMLTGSNLLKHTYDSYPHIRLFQLSQDLKRIIWYTKSKTLSESQIAIESIKNIELSQESDIFKKYPLPMLEEYSFSIYYYYKDTNEIRTLDITCKDSREFDLWVIGIKALICYFENKIICKDDLLNHSMSYCSQVKNGQIGNCSKFLIYTNNDHSNSGINNDNNHKSSNLEKFISNRNICQKDMALLFLKLSKKANEQKSDINDLMDDEKDEDNENKNNDYQELFADEAIADDTETQKSKMINLFQESQANLQKLLSEFLWYCNEYSFASNYESTDEEDFDDFKKAIKELEFYNVSILDKKDYENENDDKIKNFLKEMDIKLWKLQIDFENVGDIIIRFKLPKEKGIFTKIKEFLI